MNYLAGQVTRYFCRTDKRYRNFLLYWFQTIKVRVNHRTIIGTLYQTCYILTTRLIVFPSTP